MSEQRKPREVSQVSTADNVTSRLSELGATYIVLVTDEEYRIPVAVRMPSSDPIRNWAYIERAGKAGAQMIIKGKQKGKSFAEKQAWLTTWLNGGYEFTADMGDFGSDIRTAAIHALALKACQDNGNVAGAYDDLPPKKQAIVDSVALRIATDPALADKYVPLINAAAEHMLTVRHPKQVRSRSEAEDATPVDESEVNSVPL